ncbi:hypothetical protein Q428_07805 [Fervidicella metallireducens AeB]|uniref:Transcriptional regulator n=1 Tax=Fervidicella metallireducens AeB TaxID=1403537 RepID=A0A017RVR0_9CLOT|nr:LCP family protein [Fervidicella metallireducens]EYE88479.1 hypothetical protein Q428_07805 [Fervidicella metallireducens AeB]
MKKKGWKVFKIIMVIILLVSACTFGYAFTILKRVNEGVDKSKQVDISKPINVLLLGVDAGNYEDTTGKSPKRSDTIMLIRYNPSKEKIYMLSIPRDTRVSILGKMEKINAANLRGGTQLAIETIEKMLGVNIDYYAKIDYAAFRKCIDAVGGVDVTIQRDMNYDARDISIHFKKGQIVHLDGKKAEEYVRWRKNNNGGGYAMGDLGRIATQQEFLLKVFEKAKSPAGILRLPKLISTVSNYVKTDMDSKTMFKLALKLKNIGASNIEKRILDGEPRYINGVSYYIWDKEKNSEYVNKFIEDETVQVSQNFNRNDVRVIILNSTNVNGLAKRYKDLLTKKGYNVIKIGNYKKTLETTTINDYSHNGIGKHIYEDITLAM